MCIISWLLFLLALAFIGLVAFGFHLVREIPDRQF